MSYQILAVFFLTFVIYIIATLSYSVRIVGVRTGRFAIAFSVFNIFALISRTASSFQEPLLAKTIEISIKAGTSGSLLYIFRWILISATLGTIVGAILIPSFIGIFSKAVMSFSIHRSIPKLLIHGFSKSGVEQFKNSITVPHKETLAYLKDVKKIPKKIVLLNLVVFSITTVGALASLYAGCLNPGLRTTCSTLSPVIVGVAVILIYIFIDPYVSMLTDDVIRGECSVIQYNRCIAYIVGGLIAGTILAQLLLVPSARVISLIAKIL